MYEDKINMKSVTENQHNFETHKYYVQQKMTKNILPTSCLPTNACTFKNIRGVTSERSSIL